MSMAQQPARRRTAQQPAQRHEQKYFISQGDACYLSHLLRHTMQPDRHADGRGEYHIRSLYFDDCFNSAMSDKLDGVMHRHKYRIRIYNFSDKIIRLERKSKRGDYISKLSCSISRDLAEQIIAGDPYGLETLNHPLLQDVYRMMTTYLLRPAVIVDYVREAYVHPAEEVRITFDKQLHTGLGSIDLFNPYVPTLPTFDHDEMILEVKFNRVMPPYIRDLLCTCVKSAQNSAISKYVWCRRFENFE